MPEIEKLTTTEAADRLIAASSAQPVLFFKHSLTCSISAGAYHRFERYLAAQPASAAVKVALIEVQNARPVSNHVAATSGVRHESPQALLFCAGQVVWHASHGDITEAALTAAVAKAAAPPGPRR